MYLHIGGREAVPEADVVGLFDLDHCTAGKRAKAYLDRAEKEGVVLYDSGELPRSFVVCTHPYHDQIVYLSQLNTATLKRRWERGEL